MTSKDLREFGLGNSPVVKIGSSCFLAHAFKFIEPEAGSSSHSIVHFKDGSSLRVEATTDEISDAITEALRGKRVPADLASDVMRESEFEHAESVRKTPKTPRTTRIDYPLIPEALSRLGPVILLPVDNAPDFGFFALILKSVAEDPENALYSFVTLHDGMTWRVRATVDEVNAKVIEAWCKCEPLETVAKTSTITLRDQLALNASVEYVSQVKKRESDSNRCYFPTDAEVRYIIADEMLKARGPQ